MQWPDLVDKYTNQILQLVTQATREGMIQRMSLQIYSFSRLLGQTPSAFDAIAAKYKTTLIVDFESKLLLREFE